MASAVDRVQMRLQEAMDQGNQATLGQAIDASKGVNGLKQLRRSAKARLKQLSADQNRSMIGSHQQQHQQQSSEDPLTWRTSEQGGRYRAVAHLPTSIIGWVIGHKGCNARMLKQQTGTELWVDVPGQCVIIESRAVREVEGGMEAVNDFVKTAPTFIAKVQSGGGGGITQTVQCPVHLLPSIQRLSRKIQAESGASCVFANCKMSTFCVTGDRKNVDTAVAMLKRLIAEGNVDRPPGGGGNAQHQQQRQQQQQQQQLQQQQQQQQQHGNGNGNGNGNSSNGNGNGNGVDGDRRGPVAIGIRGPVGSTSELGQRLGRVGSDMSRSDGSPLTAPCSPEVVQTVNAWGGGASSHLRTWNTPQQQQQQHHQQQQQQQQQQPEQSPRLPTPTMGPTITAMPPSLLTVAGGGGGPLPPQHTELAPPSHYPVSAPTTPGGTVAPFQGSSAATTAAAASSAGGRSGCGGGSSSDLSFFSFGVGGVGSGASPPAPGSTPSTRASTAPTPGVCGLSGGGGSMRGGGLGLPGLGFLEESSGAGSRQGFEQDSVDDERRPSSCGSGEYGGGEAHGFSHHSRQGGSVGSLGVGSGSGGGGTAGVTASGGVGGCPLEGTIDELLEELGLAKYLHVFRNAEVDLSTLCIMSEQDFRELGILKGPRVKIMHHIGSR